MSAPLWLVFQSTHPLRGATPSPGISFPTQRFQSTHPLRGATRSPARRPPVGAYFNPRTPCGVRPFMWSNYKQNLGDFNPRTPCGVRLHRTVSTQAQSNFNPRTPCGVRRIGITKKLTTKGISIHAPLAGCDGSNGVWWPIFNYFNPRTPCGVRLSDTGTEK